MTPLVLTPLPPSPVARPYELYQKVDYVYGIEAFKNRDGFGPAQGPYHTSKLSTLC